MESALKLLAHSKNCAASNSDAVSHLKTIAAREGLDGDAITKVTALICGKGSSVNLTLQHRVGLVPCLIPRSTVPMPAVYQCLSSMPALPASLQQALLQWLILVLDLLEDGRGFLATYDLIFHLLQYDSVRPIVAQLLCFMTRREHVRKFRVQQLLDLCNRVTSLDDGWDKGPLLALVTLYRFISPGLVATPRPFPRGVWFKTFEGELSEDIWRVQSSFLPPSKKRRKAMTGEKDGEEEVTVSGLTSVSQLCQNISSVQLGDDVASQLDSSFLPHVLSVCAEPAERLRFSCRLYTLLHREWEGHVAGSENSQMSHLLEGVANLTEQLQELVPGAMLALKDLLHDWSGEDFSQLIFRLLRHLPLMEFMDLRRDFLEPVVHLIPTKLPLPSGRRFRHGVVRCLTELLRYWAWHQWPLCQHICRRPSPDTSKRTGSTLFADSVWNSGEVSELNAVATVHSLVAYSETVVLVALEMDRGHSLIMHAAADFYELVTMLPEKYELPVVMVPHPHLAYLSLLHGEPSALSRTLPCYIRCLNNIRESRTVERTSQLNSTVLDLCEALWKCRAFVSYTNRSCPTKLFTTDQRYLEASGITGSVAGSLSVFNHPALLPYTIYFLRNERHVDVAGCADLRDLISEKSSKVRLLNFLRAHELTGLADFISTFIVLN